MGYFKNQIIANQVELGDRIPEPKPASSHVANMGLVSRRMLRDLQQEQTDAHRGKLFSGIALALAVGILIGFPLGVIA